MLTRLTMRGVIALYLNPLQSLPRPTLWLCAAAFINMLGFSLPSFLPIHLQGAYGLSLEATGHLLLFGGLGAIAGSWWGGWASDRWKPKTIFGISLAFHGAFILLLGLKLPLAMIAAVLAGASFFGASFRPPLLLLLNESVPKEQSGMVYSAYLTVVNLACAIGGVITGFAFAYGFSWICWIDGGTAILAAAILYQVRHLLPEKKPAPSRQESTHEAGNASVRSELPLLSLYCFALLMCCIVFFQNGSTWPVYATSEIGLSPAQLGSLNSLKATMILFFALPAQALVKKQDKYWGAAYGSLLICLGYALAPLSASYAWAALLTMGSAFGAIVAWPKGLEILHQNFPNTPHGIRMGAYQGMHSIAQVVAPWLGTALYAELGPNSFWGICGMIGFVSAASYLTLRRTQVLVSAKSV